MVGLILQPELAEEVKMTRQREDKDENEYLTLPCWD